MYTSKMTSVNKKRTANVYQYVGYDMKDKSVLDYGCGRYYEICKDKAYFYGASNWTGYDPYWKPQDLSYRTFDIILCANVLNVIKDMREYAQCINRLTSLIDFGGTIFIQIYEGDKTEIGKETWKDCWQRNESTIIHFNRIRNLLSNDYSIKIHKKFIMIKYELPF